jgi:hypothetical protein
MLPIKFRLLDHSITWPSIHKLVIETQPDIVIRCLEDTDLAVNQLVIVTFVWVI